MSHGALVRAGHGASAVSSYLNQWMSSAIDILLLSIDVISRIISVVDCISVFILNYYYSSSIVHLAKAPQE